MSNVTTVLLCGVGGQGTVLARRPAGARRHGGGTRRQGVGDPWHGPAWRRGDDGGALRRRACAPWCADPGCADVVVSFETTEALRNLPFLKEGGRLLVADEAIKPLARDHGQGVHAARPRANGWHRCGAALIPATRAGARGRHGQGGQRGAAGRAFHRARLPRPRCGRRSSSRRVPPKTVEANLAAFRAGRGVRLRPGEGGGAMSVSQISVFLESKPGHLRRVLDAFEAAGVSVRGYSASDTGDYGIVRFVVDDPDAALARCCTGQGAAATKTEVLCVRLDDRPGELGPGHGRHGGLRHQRVRTATRSSPPTSPCR